MADGGRTPPPPLKVRVLGWVIAALIRAVGSTLRFRVEDRAGIQSAPPEGPLLWAFWHNRVFTVPIVFRKFLPSRHGAVLTSPSGDGEIIAQVMRRFGVDAVRGSSSRRGASALKALAKLVRGGGDVAVTPDGPRGPRYVLGPGLVKLAQLTGAPIFPIHLRYSKAWSLKTWDAFKIPVPFSRVDVVFDPFVPVPKTDGDEAFEEERKRIEDLLRDGVEE